MNERTQVVVADLRIPFFRLMWFFVKAGLAAIPAVIILIITISVLTIAMAALFGGSPTIVFKQWM